LYAFALAPRRPLLAGALLGLAGGAAFLCRGVLGPALIAITAVLLTSFETWRNRRYALATLVAIVVAPPLILAWPLALYPPCPCFICVVASRARGTAFFWPGSRFPAGRTFLLPQESSVVCLAGTAARAVDSVDPQPRLQR